MKPNRRRVKSATRPAKAALEASRYNLYSRSYDALYRGEQEAKLEGALGMGWLPGNRLADFGCGTALLTNTIAKKCDIAVGLDVSVGMLKHAKRRVRVELVLADASSPPFRAAAFSSCCCITAFHNFRSKGSALDGIVESVRVGDSILFSLLARGSAARDERRIRSFRRVKIEGRLRMGNDLLLLMRKVR